jgi:hypothetical protein
MIFGEVNKGGGIAGAFGSRSYSRLLVMALVEF